MTNVSLPRALGRTTVAAGAAALLALGLAAPAAADNAVRAQYTGTTGPNSVQITMGGQNVGATMFELTLEGGDTFSAYCIDLETSTRNNAWYVEDAWANYPGKGDFTAPGKVHWILQNSYPTVSAQELGQQVNLPRLSESHAMAATQAAIWHFTNGADLGRAPANVTKVYRHLIESAEDLPQEPGPSLTVTPGTAEGEAGSTVGEFAIETSAASVPVTVEAPAGVELVDLETGEAVSAVENGDKVGFEVPAGTEAGQASFSLETTAEVSAGRLFKGEDPAKPTQTLITAKSEDVTVSASATATWTAGGGEEPSPSPSPSPSEEPSESPEPTPGPTPTPTPSESPSTPASPKPTAPDDDRPALPVTGGALLGLVAAGVAALGAGGGAIYLSRKRKAASGQE
ncbi:thioester domain-containing protein [Nocardiopsis changdeensis]|uniref:Thioester domain-containing protein n=1 Tax=Nocardiopsis changdeensis TaxID=2831969 RepID=A0ABX8BMC3_9ACTN|nr:MULTISPECIES: thioester domain-containing protein [Nocardiopsis]QUX21928.1 thioester domain-containing protein [Nocardiopsis changdeensis]QYX37864.1 thioester domain-containing protein [Nocardiopsis sp. MT53]